MKSSCFANKKAGYRKRKFGSNASKKKKLQPQKYLQSLSIYTAACSSEI